MGRGFASTIISKEFQEHCEQTDFGKVGCHTTDKGEKRLGGENVKADKGGEVEGRAKQNEMR